MSDWFPRTRGVLQSSPLSPYLFNLFVDGLVHLLNFDGPTALPTCLFYADDRVLLTRSKDGIILLLPLVSRWCEDQLIQLNVSKCGYISSSRDPRTLTVLG